MDFIFSFDGYLWAIYALISAIATAGIHYVSEYYKQGGTGFLTIVRSLTAFYMLPIVLFIPWPDNPLFYFYAGITIMIIPLMDIIYFRISANLGAGVLTRITPLPILLVFAIWLCIDTELLQSYLDSPYIFTGLLISLLGLLASLSLLQKCPVSMKAIRSFLPVLILMPISAVFTKLAFDETDIKGAAFIMLFLVSIGAIPVYALARHFNQMVKKEFIINKQVIKAGFIASIFSAILIVTINLSYDLTPNPAYTRSIAFSSGFWILLFYKLIGHKEKGRVLEGLGIVFFTILLVLLSGQV